jgi:hypothetical protein
LLLAELIQNNSSEAKRHQHSSNIGKGAILANGSVTHVDQVIPDNCFAEGVPAVIKKDNITEEDHLD